MRSLRRARRPLVALVALVAVLVVGYGIRALDDDGGARISTVALSELPPEARATIRLIEANGPFPYPDTDGAVYHNRAHRLPDEPDGYFREYTVPTPGTSDRGTRRIVTGKAGGYWYTDDGRTFHRVDRGR